MIKDIDTTLISLITLTFVITSSLSWLVLRTLKEGRKALIMANAAAKSLKSKKFEKLAL